MSLKKRRCRDCKSANHRPVDKRDWTCSNPKVWKLYIKPSDFVCHHFERVE